MSYSKRIFNLLPSATRPSKSFFLTQLIEKFASTDSMQSVREGMVWLIPCLLLSTTFLAIGSTLRILAIHTEIADTFIEIYTLISSFNPMLVTAAIGYQIAIKKRLPRLTVSLLCIAFVGEIIGLMHHYSILQNTYVLFLAIFIPLITVPILGTFYQRKWTQLTTADFAGTSVKSAINMIVPGVLASIVLLLIAVIFLEISKDIGLSLSLNMGATDSALGFGMLYTFLNSTLWFFGIHGANVLNPLVLQLNEAATLGYHVGNFNSGFMGAFVFIGGCGATLSLILAILLFSKNKMLRLLAIASIPIALFNVNELLLFGIPIILNPRLLIPFIVVPLVNALIGLWFVDIGWIHLINPNMPFNVPIGLNAYAISGGQGAAIALQIFNLCLGSLIYAPFTRSIDRNGSKSTQIYLDSFDVSITQLHEDAALYSYDPVAQPHSIRLDQIKQREQIEALSKMEFYLEFQPQVSNVSGQFVGCEALIRAKDIHGNVVMPGKFLPWLEEAKLMKNVDLWVAQRAIAQDLTWKNMGLNIPLTINVTAEALTDINTFSILINLIKKAEGRVSIEITENALADEIGSIGNAINQIQNTGAKVYIDDFGTGYSSLSYLNKFNINSIKIDRSFVLALDTEKGCTIMVGIFNFAETLGLQVVVEGIETEEQLSKIPQNHQFAIQGWLYSKSLPAEQIPDFVMKLKKQQSSLKSTELDLG